MSSRDKHRRSRVPPLQLREMATCIARDSADADAAVENVRHTLSCGLITYVEAKQLETMVREMKR